MTGSKFMKPSKMYSDFSLVFCESFILSSLPPKPEVQIWLQWTGDSLYELLKGSSFLYFLLPFWPVLWIFKLRLLWYFPSRVLAAEWFTEHEPWGYTARFEPWLHHYLGMFLCSFVSQFFLMQPIIHYYCLLWIGDTMLQLIELWGWN